VSSSRVPPGVELGPLASDLLSVLPHSHMLPIIVIKVRTKSYYICLTTTGHRCVAVRNILDFCQLILFLKYSTVVVFKAYTTRSVGQTIKNNLGSISLELGLF